MRNKISFLLIAILILTSFTFVFAADTAPADVKDTKYEEAVVNLAKKGIVTGYPDGTFRPNGNISRAEACIIVVKAIGPGENELKDSEKKSFPDLAGYDWASKYISYAAAKNVISGYPNGTFRPAEPVSYAEMASMLIRALGYKSEELTGVWPDNYISKATAVGIFKGFNYSADAPASRGNVALMTNAVAENIADATKPDEKPENSDKDEPGKKPENPLADFSGRAYGILLDVAKVLGEKGDAVDEYEFLFGSRVLYLQTNGKVGDPAGDIDGNLNAGHIYGLQMSNGIVTKFGVSANNFDGIKSPTGYEDFTDDGWATVEEAKNQVVKIINKYNDRDSFTVLTDASVYVAEVDSGGSITGYKAGSFKDIKQGKEVRLYAVTGDTPGVVEIVLVKEAK